MIEIVFTQNDWNVIRPSFNHVHEYYSRHNCEEDGNRAWQNHDDRECKECGVIIPETIQGLVSLLTWG